MIFSIAEPKPLLLVYSVYSNGKKILETKPSELSCVNGIKFFSMVWVVYGHTFCAYAAGPLVNVLDAIAYIDTLKAMIVHAGVFAVDTFFCLSGLLLTYTFMKTVNKLNKFNLLSFYLHRYLRLTPALIILIFSTTTILEYLGSGPRWDMGVQYWKRPCTERWWSSLLYIQNYFDMGSMCLGHTWYLSVDTQLYLLSPIVLVPLWKYPKYGLGILVAAILASFITLAIIVYQYEIPALMISPLMLTKLSDFSEKYYFKTHTRATPYLIGMCAGYALYKVKHSGTVMFQKVILSLWGAVIALMLGLVFAGHDTLMGFEYKAFDNVMYLTFVRPVWAMCICWVILACTCGYGGIINSFLSHPSLQVLSRFSYSLYLVHLNVILWRTFSVKNGVYFNDINLQYEFWGHFGFSTLLAVVWVLAFESPIIVMEKYIFGR
nr:unnamed protein product [Callosobruchus chinensis]